MDQTNLNNQTYIFIDGSYFCFYRYYALTNWWKNAYPEDPLVDAINNSIFVEKYKKIFIESIKGIPKKLNINKEIKPIFIVAKDCMRENIWRNKLFDKYKTNRIYDETFMGGPFFKLAYDQLFQQAGINYLLKHNSLEADDCIAITIKKVLENNKDSNIYIITSDRDYLQLNKPNVKIFNLSFKNIAENKSSTGDPITDLKIKIIMGDTSDNIPSVFPKCGFKTALKCVENPELFKKKMKDNEEYYKRFDLNTKIIDFNYIPENLANEFIEKNLEILKNFI
jgi:5'-3' exonuclease